MRPQRPSNCQPLPLSPPVGAVVLAAGLAVRNRITPRLASGTSRKSKVNTERWISIWARKVTGCRPCLPTRRGVTSKTTSRFRDRGNEHEQEKEKERSELPTRISEIWGSLSRG